jgi:transcriptional regulator with XRE-family HTH domain
MSDDEEKAARTPTRRWRSSRSSRTPSEAAADSVRLLRNRRGWTQQELADRLAEVGVEIERSTIAKIEQGVRTVTLDEVFALALVLGVAPSVLMLPRDGLVAVTPTDAAANLHALEWVRGVMSMPHPEDDDDSFYFEETLDDEARLLREYPELRRMRQALNVLVLGAATGGIDRRYRPVFDSLLRDVEQLRRQSEEELGGDARSTTAMVEQLRAEMSDALERKARSQEEER